MDDFLGSFAKIILENFKNILGTLTSESISIKINSKGLAHFDDFSEEFKNGSIATIIEKTNNLMGGILFYREELIGLSNLMLIGKFQQEELFSDDKMDAAMELLRQLLSGINVDFTERFGEKMDLQIREILEVDDSLIKRYVEQYIAISYDIQIGEKSINALFFIDNRLNMLFKEDAEETEKIQNIDLLLDIEVPVAVKIGTTKIFLKDLLNLTSGNVIELDQSVNEPVELTINNKTIAYGEVVVADGYFGLKIKEIINKTERIKRLSNREA
jgi:flagellar motor switch protein FliN/FliY